MLLIRGELFLHVIYTRIKYWTNYLCNILTFDLAVNQETGASGGRYQDMTLTVDGLNYDAHGKKMDVKQLYNPVPQTVRVSWSQLVEFELQFRAVRTSSQQRACALRTPGWVAQQNEKEVLQ